MFTYLGNQEYKRSNKGSPPVPRVIAPLLGLVVCALPCSESAASEREWVEQQRQAWNVPGVVVVIARQDSEPILYASGICDIERNIPCTTKSQFQIGSVSKFFTGLLAATLAAEKEIQLDEPLIEAWPEFRLSDTRWVDMTLRDLLSGRSGLGSVDWPYFWDEQLSRTEYLGRLRSLPMERPFRSKWAYANANFVAAGAYLERVTGKSWENLTRERLFAPLEMRSSGFLMPLDGTRGYGLDGNGKNVAMARSTSQAIGPAGTIVSNAEDLSHFLTMLVNDGKWAGKPAIPAAALTAASAPTATGMGYDRRYYGAPGAYGLGLFLASYRGHFIANHSGGYAGYTAHLAWLPHKKISVVVLANRNVTQFAEAMTLGLLDRALGEDSGPTMSKFLVEGASSPAPSPKPGAPMTRPLDSYVGSYSSAAWGSFRVKRQGDQLQIDFGAFTSPLNHLNYDSFDFPAALNWERIRIRFDVNFDGNIDGFLLEDGRNSAPQRFNKMKQLEANQGGRGQNG